MTCDTSMLHGRGVSFAQAEAELVWPEILHDAAGGELQPVYGRGRAVAAGTRGAGRSSRPAATTCGRYVIPDARALPGSRVSVPVQLLLGDQDRRAANSQPEHRHHAGQPPRREGRRRADDHVHLRQLQQVPRGRGRCWRPWSRSGSGWSSSSSAIRRSPDKSTWWRFWPGPGASRCSSASSRSTARRCWRPRRARTVRRPTETSCGCAASTESVRTFPTSLAFPQDTEREVHEHLEVLRELGPTWASFYILCPIPGTEQYDDFMAEGLITENEPRPVRHDVPDLAPPSLLARAVVGVAVRVLSQVFLVGARVAATCRDAMSFRGGRRAGESRWEHGHVAVQPVLRVAADASHVRRDRSRAAGRRGRFPLAAQGTFGFELAPLPKSLQLPAAESRLNQVLGPRGLARLEQMAGQPHAGSPVLNAESQHSR